MRSRSVARRGFHSLHADFTWRSTRKRVTIEALTQAKVDTAPTHIATRATMVKAQKRLIGASHLERFSFGSLTVKEKGDWLPARWTLVSGWQTLAAGCLSPFSVGQRIVRRSSRRRALDVKRS